MTTPDRWTRRRLLGTLGLSTAALTTATLRPGGALAACLRTPAQTEGPFYPPRFGQPGNDLIVTGTDGRGPAGQPIAIVGTVTDAQCRPLAGAVVEIWQADASGHYAHPRDSDAAERDPHFRYWGRAVTDAAGTYRFRTIQPAAYSMGWSWRTPHVHFKVRRPGAVLTTQMYFPDQELNDKDSILRRLSGAAREAVIARPEAPGADGLTPYRFDIAVV